LFLTLFQHQILVHIFFNAGLEDWGFWDEIEESPEANFFPELYLAISRPIFSYQGI